MRNRQLLEASIIFAVIPIMFLFWAVSGLLDAAPQTGNALSQAQIDSLTYNPTPGAVQVSIVGRGITTPVAGNALTSAQIANLTYNPTPGAVQVYVDSSTSSGIPFVSYTGTPANNQFLQYNSTRAAWWNTNDLTYPTTTITQQSYSISSAGRAGQYVSTYSATGASTIHLMTDLLTAGRTVRIQDTGGAVITNNITIDTQGAETIMGGNTLIMQSNYAGLTLLSDGANWFVSDKQGIVRSDLNLATNGDCSVTTGWTAVNGTLASIAGGQAGNACELTMASGSSQYFYRDIPTVLGRTYQFSMYVKSGTSGNENSRVNPADATTTYPVWYNQKATTNAWVQYTFAFVATSSSTRLLIYKYTATAGTMLFDTIEVYGLL